MLTLYYSNNVLSPAGDLLLSVCQAGGALHENK